MISTVVILLYFSKAAYEKIYAATQLKEYYYGTSAMRERYTPSLRITTFELFIQILKRRYKPLSGTKFNSTIAITICKGFFLLIDHFEKTS